MFPPLAVYGTAHGTIFMKIRAFRAHQFFFINNYHKKIVCSAQGGFEKSTVFIASDRI